MVLPFEPMTMTFKDLHYWVQIPKVSSPPPLYIYLALALLPLPLH